MTMLERVAAKIAERGGSSWDDCLKAPGQKMANMYRGMARAAIEALMEPTEEMLEAALDESGNRVTAYEPATEGGVPIECGMSDADAAEINSLMKAAFAADFRAAIKAALEEGK